MVGQVYSVCHEHIRQIYLECSEIIGKMLKQDLQQCLDLKYMNYIFFNTIYTLNGKSLVNDKY